MLKQETKVTVNEKIKHLADAIYNVRSNWRYTTRIVIAGDTVRIYIVGRNFHIACIRVDTTKLEDKAKKSNDVTLRYHMKHDDLVFRMIETNDEYKVLNTITQLLIECPDPVVHDDEGFQVMIPAKSFYGRKFRPNHKRISEIKFMMQLVASIRFILWLILLTVLFRQNEQLIMLRALL